MQIVMPVTPGMYDVHVVPVAGGWAVKQEDHMGYTRIEKTQLEAMSYGMQLAREAACSLIVHGTDGRFRTVWSYKG